MKADNAQLARFRRLAIPQADGCWLWTGPYGTKDGYGKFQPAPGHPRYMAHKWSYEVFKGPIPEGMQVGHTCHDRAVEAGTCSVAAECRHRRCCNPDHLELQTPSENTMLQNHAARAKTECPKGHPYAGANLIIGKDGKRRCRECDQARKRQSQPKQPQ